MVEFGNLMDIQRNIASRLERDSRMDRAIELLGIIQELVVDGSGRVPKEQVLFEATQRGMLRAEAEVLLRDLIRDKSVSEDGGYILL
ncbi:MAG: hypothetical protein ACLFTH_03055 [Candidatus Woesearchaeota archaeon]